MTKILIVEKRQGKISSALKAYFKKFDNDVYLSSQVPSSIALFDYCFLIDEDNFLKKINNLNGWKKIIFITHDKKSASVLYKNIHAKKIPNIKVIDSPSDELINDDHIEEMIWFGISKSPEIFLKLTGTIQKKQLHKAPKHLPRTPFYFMFYLFLEKLISKKNITIIAIMAVLIYHLAFIAPLFYGGFLVYRAIGKMQTGDIVSSGKLLQESATPVAAAKTMYSFARPTFLLFSIAQFPDDLFAVHEKTLQIAKISKNLQESIHKAFILILKKNKSPSEIKQTTDLIQSSKDTLAQLETTLVFLNQKIPSNLPLVKKYKDKLISTINMVVKAKKISPFFSHLLGQDGEKKYLILFANNMELRPGGGFLGSYGVLTMKNLTFEDLKVYDVYDADGQLTAHVVPPDPIRDYLSQPHWFLRDSAFSPDFYDNYFQAKFFLEKEKQLNDFSGGILVTTTAIKNILKAFGDLYIPDFNEKITSDNFYLKTQLYAEKDFFPGSTQKKSFLSAITRQLLINLETVSEQQLVTQVFKSSEEKQITFYIEEPELQKIIDSYYWSGRIIEPHCPPDTTNCYADFLFPYDANLGVNKANFFMNRTMAVKVNIDSTGIVHTLLNMKFRNESLQDIFPGGVYRNYLQILIPRDSVIKKVTFGNELVEDYHQEIGQFKKIGFFFETPLQTTTEVTIAYQSLKGFQKGKSIYQLLFQKQIGSINNDLSLEITFPPNMFLVNQNFSPLVKNNQILYNTDLSADKIFFIELLKE